MSIKFVDATYTPGSSIGTNSISGNFFYHREPQYLVTYLNLSTGKQSTKDCYNELKEYAKKFFNTEEITSEILTEIENNMKNGRIPFTLY